MVRVARCARRVVATTAKLVETATEPFVGKRILPVVHMMVRVGMVATWLVSRPFVSTAQFVGREAYKLIRSSGRFLKSLVRPNPESAEAEGVPLQAGPTGRDSCAQPVFLRSPSGESRETRRYSCGV